MIKNFFKKKLEVPLIKHVDVEAIQLWQVEWKSRYEDYSYAIKDEFEVFTSEEHAKEFAEALRAAFKLIRHTYGNEVKLSKRF